MRKYLLFLLLLLPSQLFAKNYDEFFQGIFVNKVNSTYDERYENNLANNIKISGKNITDLTFENNYNTTDSKNQFNNTEILSRFFSDINFSKNLSLKSNILLSKVDAENENIRRKNSANGGGDMSFENSGIYIQELVLDYSEKNYSILAGKFTANFGQSWIWGRGIWANSVPLNYAQNEKLGFGGIYRIGDSKKTGRYNFAFSTFTNDRKNLDNSIINNRNSSSKNVAKAGDTRNFDSYNISLDVNFDFAENEKLSYHFAYLNLAVNSNQTAINYSKIADQKGFVLNSRYRYPVDSNLLFDGLVEYVEMKNIDGNGDASNKNLNYSLVAEIYQNWNITLANNIYKNSVLNVGNLNYNQNLYEISGGYKFDKTKYFDQFLIQLGYKKLRNNYQSYIDEQNAFGILARYIKLF